MSLPFSSGTRVRIATGDPTKYMRRGHSAAPPENMCGTVVGSALVNSLGKNRLEISVVWDDGTSGIYWENAFAKEIR